jgi:hypothetical protein
VDKELPPAKRHTMRTLRVFKALQVGSYDGLQGNSRDGAASAEVPPSLVKTEHQLVLAHRALIVRIRALCKDSAETVDGCTSADKTSIKPGKRTEKNGQGLLF